jgi:hypothetical protein
VLVKTVDMMYGIAWFLIVLLFVAAIVNFEQGTATGLIARYEFLTVLLAKFGVVGAALAYLRRSDNCGSALQARSSHLQGGASTPEALRQHPWH